MIDDDENPIKVTIKYCYPEHKTEIMDLFNGSDFRSSLREIYEKCRTARKHGDNLDVADFASDIMDLLPPGLWE